MLKRYPDWQSRLHNYLDSVKNTSFQYGSLDCCLFSCDCIEAMTGTDIAFWFRGKYKNRKEAFALIKERTGKATVEAIAEYTAKEFDMPPVLLNFAQRGDMVVIGTGRKAVLGIVSLLGTDAMAVGKKGVHRVPLSEVSAAYRV